MPIVREGPIPAGPAVRRLARELGVDLAAVAGSGKHGRIVPEDLRPVSPPSAAPASPAPVSAAPVPPAIAPRPAADVPLGLQPLTAPGEAGSDSWGPVRREKISRIRRTIAEQMVRSAATIPHVTNFDDADVTELERLRQGVPAGQLGQNVKLTMMPFVLKAVAMVLRRHPLVNASYDEEHDQIVYKEYVNLGVAVDTPRGLVVPSIRNADQLTILQLAQTLASIAGRARGAQFGLEDLRGGTFTISNLGAVGGTYSTPIINYPEVAILLLGRARWLPVVRGENYDRIEPRLMMPPEPLVRPSPGQRRRGRPLPQRSDSQPPNARHVAAGVRNGDWALGIGGLRNCSPSANLFVASQTPSSNSQSPIHCPKSPEFPWIRNS